MCIDSKVRSLLQVLLSPTLEDGLLLTLLTSSGKYAELLEVVPSLTVEDCDGLLLLALLALFLAILASLSRNFAIGSGPNNPMKILSLALNSILASANFLRCSGVAEIPPVVSSSEFMKDIMPFKIVPMVHEGVQDSM